jgi:Uma2 family endonuclease
MNSVATKTLHTPEDLLAMPDGDRYEIVDGNLVERLTSLWSSYIAGSVFRLIHGFCQTNKLGWVLPEGTSYSCFPNHPNKVRRPDVSFIRLDRLSPQRALAEGHAGIAPDLAVEVISPNDLYEAVGPKVDEWFEAGVRLVWVVNPRTRTVRIRRPEGKDDLLREDQDLTGEDVLPNFRCQVREFFLPPAGATPPTP